MANESTQRDWLSCSPDEMEQIRRELDAEALGESMENFFQENRSMGDKKYFLPTPTQMKNVVHGDDRYYSRRDPKRDNYLLIAVVLFVAVFFGVFMWWLSQ